MHAAANSHWWIYFIPQSSCCRNPSRRRPGVHQHLTRIIAAIVAWIAQSQPRRPFRKQFTLWPTANFVDHANLSKLDMLMCAVLDSCITMYTPIRYNTEKSHAYCTESDRFSVYAFRFNTFSKIITLTSSRQHEVWRSALSGAQAENKVGAS